MKILRTKQSRSDFVHLICLIAFVTIILTAAYHAGGFCLLLNLLKASAMAAGFAFIIIFIYCWIESGDQF